MRILLLTALCLPLSPAFAEADPRPRGNDQELQAAVDSLRLQHDIAGVAAAVFEQDRIRVFTSGEGISSETSFRIGNAGEIFVATALLALTGDGSLSLDDGVLGRAPEIDLRNDWYPERPVTVRHLMLHQSGLARPHFRDVVMPAERQPLLAAINRSFRAAESAFRPGSRSRYSAMNVAIAAYIAEQAAEADLQEIIDVLVNVPLQTGISLGRRDDGLHALAHDESGMERDPLPLNLAVAGDWWASAGDLARFGQLLLNDGMAGDRKVLDPELVRSLESPLAGIPERGLGLLREMPDGHILHVIRGRLPGYMASLGYFPGRGGGVVVLINQGGRSDALGDFEQLLAGQLPQPAPPEPLAEGGKPPARLTGWYALDTELVPPQRLLEGSFGFLRAETCAISLCIDGPLTRKVRVVEHDVAAGRKMLRPAAGWWPQWRWTDDGDIRIWNADREWRAVAFWRAWLPVVALGGVFLLSLATFWQFVRLPVVAWRNRKREEGWLELLPASLAAIAVIAAVLVPVLFYSMTLQELAIPGAMSIALLAASIITPTFAMLATAAYVVAWWRDHLESTWLTATSLAAAIGWSILFLVHDVVAFQSWNY